MIGWISLSVIMGFITDVFLKLYFNLSKQPVTVLLSLLFCSILITAFDNPILIAKGCLFVQILILAGYIDQKTRVIPNALTASAALCGLIGLQPVFALEGAVLMFAVTMLHTLIFNSMGGGDIKLMTACGFVLGLYGACAAGILIFTISYLVTLILRRDRKEFYPFGPFIGIGCYIAFIIFQ